MTARPLRRWQPVERAHGPRTPLPQRGRPMAPAFYTPHIPHPTPYNPPGAKRLGIGVIGCGGRRCRMQ